MSKRIKAESPTHFKKLLAEGRYTDHIRATIAVGRSTWTDKQKAMSRKAIEKHFNVTLKKRVALKNVTFKAKTKAKKNKIDKRFKAQLPFHLVFFKANSDSKVRENILELLRSAVDNGQTLPELVKSMEEVG